MENTFDKKKYNAVINIAYIVLKILIIFAFIAGGVLLLGEIVMIILPREILEVNLSWLSQVDNQFTNIMIAIDPNIFDSTANVKNLAIMAILTGLMNLVFMQYILINLKNLVKSIKTDVPFRNANAVILRNMGIGFLIASVVLSLLSTLTAMTAVNSFDVLSSMDYNFSINMQYVFMGFLILILAYVFSYGSFLQEEHDSTI